MNEQTETFWGDEIQAELEHQEEIGGTKLDFTRPPAEWRRLLQHQLNEMLPANRMTAAITDEENYRACLVKVAALAVAALQSFDRLEARQAGQL